MPWPRATTAENGVPGRARAGPSTSREGSVTLQGGVSLARYQYKGCVETAHSRNTIRLVREKRGDRTLVLKQLTLSEGEKGVSRDELNKRDKRD